MVIDVVDNRGVTSMVVDLKTCLREFNVARMATASLTRGALADLKLILAWDANPSGLNFWLV